VSPLAAGLGIFGILIVYTVLSGEVGGILTQAFQGLVMVVAGLILIVRFFQITGGFGPVLDAVSTAGTVTVGDLEKTFTPDAVDAWGTFPGAVAMAWVLIPIVGVICQPQVLTRMYALKDPRELANASLYGTAAHMVVAFMVLCVGFGALHLVATGAIPPLERPDQAIYAFADYAGPGAQLFVYAAVLAAAMSTSSLFLSLAGGIVSRDLPSALGVPLSGSRQVTVSRITIALLGLSAIVFALSSGDLVAILGTFGFGTLMSATFPVFVLGLLWKGATGPGVFAGLVVALVTNVVSLVLDQYGFRWPGGLPWYVNVVAATVAVSVVGSLLTPPSWRRPLDPRVEAVLDL
jgi:Na+/proline symporter